MVESPSATSLRKCGSSTHLVNKYLSAFGIPGVVLFSEVTSTNKTNQMLLCWLMSCTGQIKSKDVSHLDSEAGQRVSCMCNVISTAEGSD